MSVIVTGRGFGPDDIAGPIPPLDAAPPEAEAIDLPNTADARAVAGRLARLRLIRIGFPAMSDGRGFTLARRLRAIGYAGRLRAAGPLIADQFPLLLRAGFDEVEIPAALAARQPAAQWLAALRARPADHRSRLAGVPSAPAGL